MNKLKYTFLIFGLILTLLIIPNIQADYVFTTKGGPGVMTLDENGYTQWTTEIKGIDMIAEIILLIFLIIGSYYVLYARGYQIYCIMLWFGTSILSMAILDGVAVYIGFFGFLTTIILFVVWLKENNQKIFKGKIKF
jgi:hypothetical protein